MTSETDSLIEDDWGYNPGATLRIVASGELIKRRYF